MQNIIFYYWTNSKMPKGPSSDYFNLSAESRSCRASGPGCARSFQNGHRPTGQARSCGGAFYSGHTQQQSSVGPNRPRIFSPDLKPPDGCTVYTCTHTKLCAKSRLAVRGKSTRVVAFAIVDWRFMWRHKLSWGPWGGGGGGAIRRLCVRVCVCVC